MKKEEIDVLVDALPDAYSYGREVVRRWHYNTAGLNAGAAEAEREWQELRLLHYLKDGEPEVAP